MTDETRLLRCYNYTRGCCGHTGAHCGVLGAATGVHVHIIYSIDVDKSLDYWRLNAPKYPRLAKLAKHYLSIPASSASVVIFYSWVYCQGKTVQTVCANPKAASSVQRTCFEIFVIVLQPVY